MPATPQEFTPQTYPTISLRELETLPDPEWLVERVAMRQAITLVTGLSESFKTFFAIDLMMKAGRPEFTHFGPHYIDRSTAQVRNQLRGLYVIGESQGAAKFRFRAWSLRHNLEYPQAVRVRPDKVNLFSQPSAVQDMVEREDPDILVLDTWSRNAYGMDENSKKDIDKALEALHQIKFGGSRDGRAVVVIHHPNKSGSPSRGHTALINDTDIHIVLERQGERGGAAPFYTMVTSERQKEMDDFRPYMLTLDTQIIYDRNGSPLLRASGDPITSLVPGGWTIQTGKPDGRPARQEKQDYVARKTAGEFDGMNASEIADKLGVPVRTVYRWRKEDPEEL